MSHSLLFFCPCVCLFVSLFSLFPFPSASTCSNFFSGPSSSNETSKIYRCGSDFFSTGWNSFRCLDPSAAENQSASKPAVTDGFLALYISVGCLSLLFCAAIIIGTVKLRAASAVRRREKQERMMAEANNHIKSMFLVSQHSTELTTHRQTCSDAYITV